MVKGISRQVIVVHSPDPKLFEQAIFILRDDAKNQQGVTDEALLREANRLIKNHPERKRRSRFSGGPVWACGGAAVMGLAWLLAALI